jgi:hypothetical protein
MKHKLRSLLFAAAAFVATNAAAPVYAAVPPHVISIDNGVFVIDEYAGQYVVHNYSSDWSIYAFAVSNPNAFTDDPTAHYNSWAAQAVSLGINSDTPRPANVYYSSYIDLSNGIKNPPLVTTTPLATILLDLIGPGTTPFGSFLFNGSPASEAGLLVVNGAGQLGQFNSSATPLPSTWLMLLSGFAIFGFLAFRKSKKGVAAVA